MSVIDLAEKYKDYVITMRRVFHKIPEASMEEYKTSQKIKEELEKMGIEAQIIADTGVVAIIEGAHPGKTVALRADIDALSVEEKTGAEYASTHQGLMHACGHDGHIAMLLGAAQILKELKSEIKGKVKLIFEPGEEVAKGALKMISAGVLENVDTIFGIHLFSDIPVGKISVEAGPRMASADFFFIDIKGASSHAAQPHKGVDAIIVGSNIVDNLQTVVSREIDPLQTVVVSVCEFKAGTRFNVMAGDAYLTGTTRSFSNEVRNQLPDIMERIIKKTAETFRAEVNLRYDMGSSPIINDEASSLIAQKAVEDILGKEAIYKYEKTMTGDNFSEYLMKVPGVYAFVGVKNPEKDAIYPLHSAYYKMDEDALILGSSVAVQYALNYLNQNS